MLSPGLAAWPIHDKLGRNMARSMSTHRILFDVHPRSGRDSGPQDQAWGPPWLVAFFLTAAGLLAVADKAVDLGEIRAGMRVYEIPPNRHTHRADRIRRVGATDAFEI